MGQSPKFYPISAARLKSCLPDFYYSLSGTTKGPPFPISERLVFRRPETKKKNAARSRKNSVNPNIFASYFHTEVICLAGKKASAIPKVVVRNPHDPANSRVARP